MNHIVRSQEFDLDPSSGTVPRLAIIGGGPGGLFTAYLLQKYLNRPVHIDLFEASPRLGGKIQTLHFTSKSQRYEAGAAEFYDYSQFDDDSLKSLISELGLVTNPFAGQSVLIGEHIVSNLDDVQFAWGPVARRELELFHTAARNSLSPTEFYLSNSDESPPLISPDADFSTTVSELLDPNLRRYVQTLIHSDLATEPQFTNVTYGLHNYLMNDPAYMQMYTIVGGNEQLPQALAARLSANIHLGQTVTVVDARNSSSISLMVQSPQAVVRKNYDFVVVALPHDRVLRLDYRPQSLQRSVAAHHQHYHYPAHYLRITLLFDNPFWRPFMQESFCMLEQWDGCCLYDESSRDVGCEHGVLGWLCAGQSAIELAQRTDEELTEMALATLPKSWPDPHRHFCEGRVHRWLNSVNAMPGGRNILPMDQRHQPDGEVFPNLYWVGDYLFDSTLYGVLESADYVAEQIACRINSNRH